jgi:hypothetical protein
MKADQLWLTLATKKHAHQAMVLAVMEEQPDGRFQKTKDDVLAGGAAACKGAAAGKDKKKLVSLQLC